MNRLFIRSLIPTLVLVLAPWANAGIWTEIGDAGSAGVGAAQVTVGANNPLTNISGTVGFGNDADVFAIFISSPATFSATTVGTGGTLIDTQLFLFNSAGIGVASNDDAVGLRSTLPAGNPLLTALTPGIYYIGISNFDQDPVSVGGLIFNPPAFNSVVGPNGPGGGSPWTGFNLGGGDTGTYNIALTGAEFAAVPEPGSLTLLGVGVVGLVGYVRRQRRQTT